MPDDFEELIEKEREERSRKEQQLKKQEEDEKATHRERANQFINAMRSRDLPPFEIILYDEGNHYGWIVRDCSPQKYGEPGVVVTTDGRAFKYGYKTSRKAPFKPGKYTVIVGRDALGYDAYRGPIQDSERLLAHEGSDRMLAQAVVDNEQGKLGIGSSRQRREDKPKKDDYPGD